MRTEDILKKLKKVTITGNNQWKALCPAHDDKNPSLSIKTADNGDTLLCCHAGCNTEAICADLDIKTADLFANKQEKKPKPIIDMTYVYTDKDEREIYEVLRYKPKDFRQRHKVDGEYVWNMNGVERVLYHLPEVLNAQQVWLVEGEKDVESLRQQGQVATCNVGGANKWDDSYTADLAGKEVNIIADADEPGRKHARTVARELLQAGCKVKVAECPDGSKDVSDYLARSDNRQAAVERLRQHFESLDEFVPDGRSVTSPENGLLGGRPRDPEPSLVADELVATLFTNAEGRITLRYWNGVWYQYKGGWAEIPENEMENIVSTFLRTHPLYNRLARTHYIRNILINLRAHDSCGLPLRYKMPCWTDTGENAGDWMGFENTTINITKYAEMLAGLSSGDSVYQRPVTPDFFSTDIVPYKFDPQAECPMFMKYIEEVLPDPDDRLLAQKMSGLMMADCTDYDVFFFLLGAGNNGKTVLLEILANLIGHSNVSYVPIGNLCRNFQTWPLAFSKMNVCGDFATDIGRGTLAEIEGFFKDCVSGTEIEVERKGKDKYTARCRARFVMGGNSLPTFIDRSNGIWRRMRIIQFPCEISKDKQDPYLSERICSEELPGIANWALQGYAMCLKDKGIPDSPRGAELKEAHRNNCDHERVFLTEFYEPGDPSTDRIPAMEVYNRYKNWTLASGYKPLGAGKFYDRAMGIFPSVSHGNMRINGIQCKCLSGIRSLPYQAVTVVTNSVVTLTQPNPFPGYRFPKSCSETSNIGNTYPPGSINNWGRS